jgi:hypothetical protein
MRPPIGVRPLTEAEHQRLEAGRRASDAFVLRRCQVLLARCCAKREAAGKRALLPVRDNAPWPVSATVRGRIRDHDHPVKRTRAGGRIVNCYLPTEAPWLNPIEPKWVHGKRRVVEPARLLPASELIVRVCAAFACAHEPHLAIADHAA